MPREAGGIKFCNFLSRSRNPVFEEAPGAKIACWKWRKYEVRGRVKETDKQRLGEREFALRHALVFGEFLVVVNPSSLPSPLQTPTPPTPRSFSSLWPRPALYIRPS
ncbi:hypothetical protein I312_105219 [Cryptococcus bacillisporus CA1280]|uniref:uncharacterized protein n=1 Tax=Cryptococcus bacillisporus CA1280 TaxID=1296109 RepID=UPI003369A9DF